MNGSLDVRKLLWEQDDTGATGRSAALPTQRGVEPSRVSPEQVRRARVAVARNAVDAEDCRMLLDMLGLVPGHDGVPPVRR